MVGIVARIGVDKAAVIRSIQEELERYNYNVFNIHLTDTLTAFQHKLSLVHEPSEARYDSYIRACNGIRADLGSAAMAKMAISNISERRGTLGNLVGAQARNAFIIDQIKRPEESDYLRKVYGEHYVQISCHADETTRIERLTKKFSEDHPEDPKSFKWDLAARTLVHKMNQKREKSMASAFAKYSLCLTL